jgi:hypothetical protein
MIKNEDSVRSNGSFTTRDKLFVAALALLSILFLLEHRSLRQLEQRVAHSEHVADSLGHLQGVHSQQDAESFSKIAEDVRALKNRVDELTFRLRRE